MNQNQPLIKDKPYNLTVIPCWLGSVLVHLLILAIIIKVGSLPIKKTQIIWVSLSNIELQSPAPLSVPLHQHVDSGHVATPVKEPATSAVPLTKPEVEDTQKKPEKQSITKNITIEPEATQPKPQAATKIKTEVRVKRKISKAADSTHSSLPVNQSTQPPVNPQPIPSSRENQSPITTKDNSVTAQARYLQAHFEGIRDKVSDNLRYPTIAQRQGWQGQVQVRFTILLSGEIDDLQILSSSGHSILDREALQAIKIAAPFPVPSAVASITIPVTFKLN